MLLVPGMHYLKHMSFLFATLRALGTVAPPPLIFNIMRESYINIEIKRLHFIRLKNYKLSRKNHPVNVSALSIIYGAVSLIKY